MFISLVACLNEWLEYELTKKNHLSLKDGIFEPIMQRVLESPRVADWICHWSWSGVSKAEKRSGHEIWNGLMLPGPLLGTWPLYLI